MHPRRLISALVFTLPLLAACGVPPQPDSAPPSQSAAKSAASRAPAALPSQVSPSPAGASAQPASPRTAPVGTASGSPAATARPAPPTELIIPAIQIDAPVEHVGVTPDGAMDVPREWNDVGWFDQGYRPGEPGSAVIAGHLDSTTDRAVFWDLHLLKPGDKVLLKEEDGSQLTFQVTGSDVYPYNQAPLQKIFGPSSAAMLNLITCNGIFDHGSKNYDKRLVVYTQRVAG